MALDERQFAIAYWVATHRKEIRAVAILSLLTAAVLAWGVFLFYGGKLLLGIPADRRMLSNLEQLTLNLDAYRRTHAPTPIEITEVLATRSSAGIVDAMIRVRNPNPRWVATSLRYTVQVDGVAVPARTGAIMPGEEKFFLVLGERLPSVASITSAKATIDSVSWRWLEKKSDLPDVTFRVSKVTPTSPTQISFEVSNESPYSFWSVPFAVVATTAEGGITRLRGAATVLLEQFDAGETRSVIAYAPRGFGGATTVEVRPDINLLDPSVFKK